MFHRSLSRQWLRSPFANLLAGFAALMLISAQTAPQIWQTLPPMPTLPPPQDSGWVEIDSARIWWGEYNTKAGGIPVMLLHGGLGSSNYFAHLIPALIADGRRVITVDSRGQGRSSLGDGALGYERMANDVRAVLRNRHIAEVDLVGWSDGGIIGLLLAIYHPETLHRLYAYGANADPSGNVPNTENSPTFGAYLDRAARDYAQVSPTPQSFGSLMDKVTHMWSTEPKITQAQLASIRIPVTIADGQHEEAIYPDHVVYMARTIPDANMDILPGVSHFAMLQSPGTFDDSVLYFLHHR